MSWDVRLKRHFIDLFLFCKAKRVHFRSRGLFCKKRSFGNLLTLRDVENFTAPVYGQLISFPILPVGLAHIYERIFIKNVKCGAVKSQVSTCNSSQGDDGWCWLYWRLKENVVNNIFFFSFATVVETDIAVVAAAVPPWSCFFPSGVSVSLLRIFWVAAGMNYWWKRKRVKCSH